MSVLCKLCDQSAIYTVATSANGSSNYCNKHLPAVRRVGANNGLYALVKPAAESVAPAPKKKASKSPAVEETPVEELVVEEASISEEVAVESTDEDN